jgi:hypothetical protein
LVVFSTAGVGFDGGEHEHVLPGDVAVLAIPVTPAGIGDTTVTVYLVVIEPPMATGPENAHAVAATEPVAHDQPSPDPV